MSAPDRITVGELANLTSGGRAILDVLPAEQYERRHLPGAKNACVYQVGFLSDVARAGIESDTEVVVYATGGKPLAAEDAARKLRRAGFTAVRVLDGGIEAWVSRGLFVEGTGAPEPAVPEPAESEDLAVDTERSVVRFVGRNLAGRHHGTIRLAGGSLRLEHGMLAGGRVALDMTSIVCEEIADSALNRVLLDHLFSDDFFDVERYPRADFVITDVEPVGVAAPGLPDLRVTGHLTLRAMTAPVRMLLTSGRAAGGVWVAQASFDLDRTRFGVNYGSGKLYDFLGMHLVNDLISVELVVFGA
jgi:polyisoprenoid-binding protein YceI